MFIRFSLILAACLGILISAGAQTIVGTGSSSSFVVIEAADFGAPLFYEYRYNSSPGLTLDPYTILGAIDLADDDLAIGFRNFGSPSSPSYFVDVISYKGTALFFDGDFYWVQWLSGGRTSSTDWDTGETTYFDAAEGVWTYGNGISAPYRLDEPGSWNGFIFNDGSLPPGIAPIPEPSILALLSMASIGMLAVAFRKKHA